MIFTVPFSLIIFCFAWKIDIQKLKKFLKVQKRDEKVLQLRILCLIRILLFKVNWIYIEENIFNEIPIQMYCVHGNKYFFNLKKSCIRISLLFQFWGSGSGSFDLTVFYEIIIQLPISILWLEPGWRCPVVPLYSFLYSGKCSFCNQQLLRIIHTSLAHRESFHVKPSERYHPAKVFMLGRTGTNEL